MLHFSRLQVRICYKRAVECFVDVGAMHATVMTGLALMLGAVSTAQVFATEPSKQAPSCFQFRDIEGWKATDDTRGLYIRVRGHHTFRVALAAPCSLLKAPDAYLVTISRGSDRVCRPIDWDLKVAQRSGGRMGCIVNSIAELAPAEVAALPKESKP